MVLPECSTSSAESAPLVSVPADRLAEAVAVLDGLAYALALTQRDFDGAAADVAESVAGLRSALAEDVAPAIPPMRVRQCWRTTLASALHPSRIAW